jgi:hypothetical protein
MVNALKNWGTWFRWWGAKAGQCKEAKVLGRGWDKAENRFYPYFCGCQTAGLGIIDGLVKLARVAGAG